MNQTEYMTVYPHDVFIVTEKGQEELSRGSTALSASELELLVLMDGKVTVQEMNGRIKDLDEYEVAMLIPKLMRDGLVAKASIAEQDNIDFSYFFDAERTQPTAEAQAQAQQEAETGTRALQRDGYYVGITRRSAQPPGRAPGAKICVLAIEDDPQISQMLKMVLEKDGYEARSAANRAEVLAALRHLPSPDLVLLDITLPDANGFDILERMKQHPGLKAIPVIMLTGKTTREDVIRGLADGADGYITKPFEMDVLRKGIKYVLGIA